MAMSYDQARSLLEAKGQRHLLRFWDRLDGKQQDSLLEQVASLRFESIEQMQEMLRNKEQAARADIEPADVVRADADTARKAREAGEAALRAGEVGALLVAGGQGTRLGYDGPKGCFEIGPITKAPLFEIHARKILSRERNYGTQMPFYIMTSRENDKATRAFFEKNRWFGLSPDRVMFFVQGMWPALGPEGKVILDAPDHVFMSPDGHGGILSALKDNRVLDDMTRRGLKTLFYFQVDNPLVEIADPAFVGLHRMHDGEISVKVCEKTDPEERVGVVVRRGGRQEVVEYTELTREQKYAQGDGGKLLFWLGSVAIHIFSLDFLKRMSETRLPLHVAHKKVPYCRDTGDMVQPEEPNAYKFEKFIFDVLPYAERSLNVEFKREDEFSPVKNATGSDSPETTQRDMIRKFARWLEACGVDVPRTRAGELRCRIEIDPCFADGVETLRSKLGKNFRIKGDTLLK